MKQKKFGLLIVDDNAQTRKNYRDYLTQNAQFPNLWDKVWEASGADQGVFTSIEDYISEDRHPIIVIADAYMEPYCDGNKVEDKNKLFGGFWLIDRINKNKKFKEKVKTILVTFYDNNELIENYIRGDKDEIFNYVEGEDYYFVEKPDPESKGNTSESRKWDTNNEVNQDILSKTIEIIQKYIQEFRDQEDSPKPSLKKNYQNDPFSSIIGESNAINEVKENARTYAKAPNNSTVLITGENGTGKELVAKAIHSISDQSDKTFETINCAAMPDDLLESELYGHVKGAFTGAISDKKGMFKKADGGILFLDEIGDMPLKQQPKLLRALQEKKIRPVGSTEEFDVDLRIISATNQNLKNKIKDGSFREDLFYRLNVLPIEIPSLKHRKEDIPLLIRHFCKKNNRNIDFFDKVMDTLVNFEWPGNVRQLEWIVMRLAVAIKRESINDHDLRRKAPELFERSIYSNTYPKIGDEVSLKEIEKAHIISVLKKTDWNIKKAEKILGKGGRSSKLHKLKSAYLALEQNNWNVEIASEILGERISKNELYQLKKISPKV